MTVDVPVGDAVDVPVGYAVGYAVDVPDGLSLRRRIDEDVFVFFQLLFGVFRQSSGFEDAVAGSSRLLVEVADDDVRKEGRIIRPSHVRQGFQHWESEEEEDEKMEEEDGEQEVEEVDED